jgi:hypothetical protein
VIGPLGPFSKKLYFLRKLRMSPKRAQKEPKKSPKRAQKEPKKISFHFIRLERFATDKHSSLLDLFVSYKENKVL